MILFSLTPNIIGFVSNVVGDVFQPIREVALTRGVLQIVRNRQKVIAQIRLGNGKRVIIRVVKGHVNNVVSLFHVFVTSDVNRGSTGFYGDVHKVSENLHIFKKRVSWI